MPEEDMTPTEDSENASLTSYTCERCGYTYRKATDFHPFLCYRCMRFIAKRVFVTMNTITPLSRTVREDI